MKVRIHSSVARGSVSAPPSKSMAHRALICAALSFGESRICGVSDCEDVSATLDCLRALGAECKIDNDTVIVKGIDFQKVSSVTLPCRESGSTMRFMLPLCLLSGKEITLVGAPSLLRRPMKVYQNLCAEHDLFFEQTEQGITVKGPLSAGEFTIPGDVSSQFISGMLFALTQLSGNSILHILPPFESRSYVLLTLQTLAAFGADVEWLDDFTLCVRGGKPMTAQNIAVEGDYSNAAFLSALNLLGGEVTVTGLNSASLQGDRVYVEHFASLADGFATISLADCPDLAPILCDYAHRGLFDNAELPENSMGAFARAVDKGVGIELNFSSLQMSDEEREISLKPYFIAKEEGCKFYFGSDAHTVPGLGWAKRNAERIIELLELTEEDKFVL